MCANPQSNQLNTIAVRASYILPICSDFLDENQEKPGGLVYLPPEKNQNRNQFVFLSFGVDPLNWQSFIEIGEMACSTTARCSRGHALNCSLAWKAQVLMTFISAFPAKKKIKNRKKWNHFIYHISLKRRTGGKENCLTENFSSHSPSTSNNVLVGDLLKTINLDKFEGDKECGSLGWLPLLALGLVDDKF